MLFFSGNHYKNALSVANNYILNKRLPIINYAVESNNDVTRVLNEYEMLIENINNNKDLSIALKMSSFDFNINYVSYIIDLAKKYNIKVYIDAEQSVHNKKYQSMSKELMCKYNKNNYTLFKTYQMYREDALMDLHDDLIICQKNNIFFGAKIVRGAYWNSEKNNGQLFLKKTDTNKSYNQAILDIYNYDLKHKNVILATHNETSCEIGQLLNQNKNIFSFAHLQGMKENYYNYVSNEHSVHVYIPYGPYNEMIPYLLRRLYENLEILYSIK